MKWLLSKLAEKQQQKATQTGQLECLKPCHVLVILLKVFTTDKWSGEPEVKV